MKPLSEFSLPQPAILTLQEKMVDLGHLKLPSRPKGGGGPLTDAAWGRWVGKAPSESPDLAEAILRSASQFVGLKEVNPNADWDDPSTPGDESALAQKLRDLMRPAPWKKGWAYCITFCEGNVIEAMRQVGASAHAIERVSALISPSVVKTAQNFDKVGLLRGKPTRGAIWLGRWGTGWTGHAGLVRSVSGTRMATIEANTSGGEEAAEFTAKDREGDWIDNKARNVSRNGKLITLGFVHPDDLLKA